MGAPATAIADERWCWATAREIARAVAAGEVSAEAIARLHLERIARSDGDGDVNRLGAWLFVDGEGAIAAARAVDDKVRRGLPVGPLAGVPVGLKDNLATRGAPTTCASRILAGWRPPYDATVVARLRDADAVLLGKLNMDEFAMGSSTESSAVRACRNPWDPMRVPGGSSGGSAAAVAAGLCAIALGSDTGGSIRQPAALSGCVGLKPTYGRVSRHGLVAFASSLDQVGPLARTAEDCALALSVIAGLDERDATSVDRPLADYCNAASARRLDGLRVGLPVEFFDETRGLAPAVAARTRAAVQQLRELGALPVEVSLPSSAQAIATYYLVATAEASSNLARFDGVRYGLRVDGGDLAATYAKTRAAGFGPEVKRRILLGTYALRAGYYDAYYRKAQQVRTLVAREFERAFAACDVIAGPTSPVAAFKLGERANDPLAMYAADVYTITCNLAGLPGLSVPCGFVDGDAGPLPVGLQLLAPPFEEVRLLAAAAAYQAATPFATQHPPRFAALLSTGGGA